MELTINNNINNFLKEIRNLCDIDVYECYQCGKCSAGCSVGKFLKDTPTQIIRYIQLNQKEVVLNSKTPYLCAVCSICSSRCPMGIDVAKLMETIRILAAKENIKPKVKEVNIFSDTFLSSVKAHGRIFEFGMTIWFNLRNNSPFKDADFGPAMLLKSKLSLLPTKIKNRKRIKEIFSKSEFFSTEDKKNG